jgi:hypothetical protein
MRGEQIVDGTQCTILWHVDDLKISHVNPDVLEDILDKLDHRFGKEQPLTVTRGTVHDYLGMKIDYSTEGKAIITMIDYIDNMLEEMPEDMQGSATSPAASYLFDVNHKTAQLDQTTSDFFHATVAKLLYLSCALNCPTGDMLSDILTKPLKGSQFRKLRDKVLNIHNDESPFASSTPQECVGTSSLQDDTTDSINPGELTTNLNMDDINQDDVRNDVAEGEWVRVENKKRNEKRIELLGCRYRTWWCVPAHQNTEQLRHDGERHLPTPIPSC